MVADVQIARGSEFQMTGATERKEREPKLVEWGHRRSILFLSAIFVEQRF